MQQELRRERAKRWRVQHHRVAEVTAEKPKRCKVCQSHPLDAAARVAPS
jgi:predicted adenine nucleotide alpha hydrolase (AANH) superfamily ATPase